MHIYNKLCTSICNLCEMDIKQWRAAVSKKAIFCESSVEETSFHHCKQQVQSWLYCVSWHLCIEECAKYYQEQNKMHFSLIATFIINCVGYLQLTKHFVYILAYILHLYNCCSNKYQDINFQLMMNFWIHKGIHNITVSNLLAPCCLWNLQPGLSAQTQSEISA